MRPPLWVLLSLAVWAGIAAVLSPLPAAARPPAGVAVRRLFDRQTVYVVTNADPTLADLLLDGCDDKRRRVLTLDEWRKMPPDVDWFVTVVFLIDRERLAAGEAVPDGCDPESDEVWTEVRRRDHAGTVTYRVVLSAPDSAWLRRAAWAMNRADADPPRGPQRSSVHSIAVVPFGPGARAAAEALLKRANDPDNPAAKTTAAHLLTPAEWREVRGRPRFAAADEVLLVDRSTVREEGVASGDPALAPTAAPAVADTVAWLEKKPGGHARAVYSAPTGPALEDAARTPGDPLAVPETPTVLATARDLRSVRRVAVACVQAGSSKELADRLAVAAESGLRGLGAFDVLERAGLGPALGEIALGEAGITEGEDRPAGGFAAADALLLVDVAESAAPPPPEAAAPAVGGRRSLLLWNDRRQSRQPAAATPAPEAIVRGSLRLLDLTDGRVLWEAPFSSASADDVTTARAVEESVERLRGSALLPAAAGPSPAQVAVAPPDVREVVAEGTASVGVGGLPAARRAAEADALRRAVESATGVFVSARTLAQNYALVRDQVTTRAEGFATLKERVRETDGPDTVTVSVRALVSLRPLAERLKSLGLTRAWRVYVAPPAGPPDSSAAAALAAVEKRLADAGFPVVTDRGSADLEVSAVADAPAAAPRAFPLETALGPMDLYSARGRLSLRATRAGTGEIVSALSAEGSAAAIDSAGAESRALAAAADAAAPRLVDSLLVLPARESQPVQLEISGVRRIGLAGQLGDALETLPGVRQVTRRSFDAASGRAVWELDVLSDALPLRSRRLEDDAGLRPFHLAVTSDAGGKIVAAAAGSPSGT